MLERKIRVAVVKDCRHDRCAEKVHDLACALAEGTGRPVDVIDAGAMEITTHMPRKGFSHGSVPSRRFGNNYDKIDWSKGPKNPLAN